MSKSGKRAKPRPTQRTPAATSRPADPTTEQEQWNVWWFWLLVLAPVLFNAIMLAPELISGVPAKNDSSLHLLMVHAASDALRDGHNPFDFWIPQLEMGFPQFLYYQHLPHVAVVALHRVFFGAVGLEQLFHIVQYLMLVCLPITVAWSMRRIGFSPAATAVGAAVSTLLAGGHMSFDYNSYIWRGPGLYTQLWGMHLSFLALASLSYTVNEGRGYVKTSLLLAALALSHLVYASMMGVTSLVVVFVGADRRTLLPRLARLAVAGSIAIALAAYMLWPFLQSSRLYMSTSPGAGRDSSGPVGRAVRSMLLGRYLDSRRLPVLTLLAAFGMVVAMMRRGRPRMLALVGLLVWLVLFVGRPMLGPLATLLPTRLSFVSYRFVGTVGMFAILVIGVAGEALWHAVARVPRVSPRVRPVILLVLIGLLFTPALIDRVELYNGNRTLIAEARAALASNPEIHAVLDSVVAHPGGRVFAGLRRSWGGRLQVGQTLRVIDLVKARQLPIVGEPYQGLALNSGLTFNFLDGNPGLYDAYDIRTVITSATSKVPPFLTPWFRNARYAVWRVPGTGIASYVQILQRQPASTQRELYRGNTPWFRSNAPAEHQAIRWDYMTPAGSHTARQPCADGGRTLEERVESQRIALVVECDVASALMLKMSYHPHWKVRVDGIETPTYMVSPSFIGFDLSPGRHTIDAAYVPSPSKVPLLALGVLTLLLAVVFRERLDAPARWIAGAPGPAGKS